MFFKEIDNRFYKGYLILKEQNEYNKISYYIPKLKVVFNRLTDIKKYIDELEKR